MKTKEVDLVEVNTPNFKVLVMPMNQVPFKKMLPILELTSEKPDSPYAFGMLARLFSEYLSEEKKTEFEDLTMQEATDVVSAWMTTS